MILALSWFGFGVEVIESGLKLLAGRTTMPTFASLTDCPPTVLLGWTAVIGAGAAYYAYLQQTDADEARKQGPTRGTENGASTATSNGDGTTTKDSLSSSTKRYSVTSMLYNASLLGMAVATVIPTATFIASFPQGMKLISAIYPGYQNPEPYLARKERIYSHMLFASTAILAGPFQLSSDFRKKNPNLHRAAGIVYVLAQFASSVASVSYAAKQPYGNDSGFAAFVSFASMAAVSLSYTARGLFYLYAGSLADHRKAMVRSYATFLGDGLFFRILAKYYLPMRQQWAADGHPYGAWVTSIWLSWAVPLMAVELWESGVAAWKAWRKEK